MRGGSVREIPMWIQQLMVGVTCLVVLATTILAIKTWPTAAQAGPSSTENMSVRVVRSQPCTSGSFEETLGHSGGLVCQEVLVEVLKGPDSGQLVALDPLFTPASNPTTSEDLGSLLGGPFQTDEIIQARVVAGEHGTSYSYVERTRTIGLFLLIGSAIVAVLVAGYWFGARAVAVIFGSVAVVVLYAVPALNQPLGGQTASGIIAIVAAIMILLLVLLMDGASKLHNQMVFLASILTTLMIISISQAFLALTRIGDPVDAASLILNPSGAGANQQGFVLLGTVIASIVLVHWIASRQVASVMAGDNLQQSGDSQSSTASLFFDNVGSSQRQTANGISLFVLASLSASLPLLGLFASNSLTTGAALNNEMLAATLVRIGAGVVGLVLASPIATGLAALSVGSLAPALAVDRSGEAQGRRPPLRREHSLDMPVLDLRAARKVTPLAAPGKTLSTEPAGVPRAIRTTGPSRLRVGVEDL